MLLADGAFQLFYRRIFMIFHPLPHLIKNSPQVLRGVFQQGCAQMGDIRAGEQQPYDILSVMDAAGCREG